MKRLWLTISFVVAGLAPAFAQGMQAFCNANKQNCDIQAARTNQRVAELKRCTTMLNDCLKGQGSWAAYYKLRMQERPRIQDRTTLGGRGRY